MVLLDLTVISFPAVLGVVLTLCFAYVLAQCICGKKMSNASKQVHQKHDVFMVFADKDRDLAIRVNRGLRTKNLEVISQLDETAFPKGQPIFGHLVKHIDSSSITLIILTEETYKSPWILLEIILSAEKSIKEGKMVLRSLVHELSKESIESLTRGRLLEKVPRITFNENNDWEKELHESVTSDKLVGDLLPVGSLAHGQVFSHFTGMLQYVLPAFKKRLVEEAEKLDLPMGHVSTKYFILLPSSCNIKESLTTDTDRSGIQICHKCTIHIVTKTHAGKERAYNLSMYSVSKGDETYYFVADLPPVLNTIYELKNETLADVDLENQMARFFFTINELVNHSQIKELVNNSVEVVTYTEDERADVIFGKVKNSICSSELEQATMRSILGPIRGVSKRKYDVFISSCDDHASLVEADKVYNFLIDKGKTVTRGDLGKPILHQLDDANWTVFIFSKDFLDDKLKIFECISFLAACINENSLRILPIVLEDVDVNRIPSYMKFIAYMSNKEPKFEEKILQIMNGGPVRMCEKLPCWNVAIGLAWGYVINYLSITLGEDLEGRIKDFLREKQIVEGCKAKMFVIVPHTCTVKDSVAKEANLGSTNSTLKELGPLKPVIAANGRTYNLNVYKYTSRQTGSSVCFICEYATPINCLHEMADRYAFAGLGKEDMYKQAEDFVKQTRSILIRDTVKKKYDDLTSLVDFIQFDDRSQSLMSAIEDQLALPHPKIFAQEAIP